MIYTFTLDMPESPSVYLTFYESSWEKELLFDWGIYLFIYLLIFIKISTNDVEKNQTSGNVSYLNSLSKSGV